MRSPPCARVPARVATEMIVAAALLVGACTNGTEPVTDDPTPSQAPTPARETALGGGARSGDDIAPETRVRIADKDVRRTVRGEAPPYIEIESASVDGSVSELTFEVALAGRVPERMPDNESILRVTFTVVAAGGRRYTFEAQCIRPGWGAFASGGPEDAPVPDIAFDGKRVALTIDPAYMGGLQPFEWLANVAWTSGEANYAFDAAPKRGFADYP